MLAPRVGEYFPASQAVHVAAPAFTAPVPSLISATEPASHIAQVTVELTVNIPGPQAVHVVGLMLTAPVP